MLSCSADTIPMKKENLQVKVVPRASSNQLIQNEDGTYTARVTAPPVEGEANEAVIRLLAKHLKVAPSQIELVSGATSRVKRFRVSYS
jgi:uncharacterized protein (TIGR00251 family)